jgi:proline dehydrogenase
MPVELVDKEKLEQRENTLTLPTQNFNLIDSIPLKMVLWLASPYLAGKNLNDAITLAHKLYKNSRFTSTIDILGEDAISEEDCLGNVDQYKEVIDAVASNPLPCKSAQEQITISFKPSMFSTLPPQAHGADKELEKAYERIHSIVKYAFAKNIKLTLEAEDHRWTDFQLDTYFSLINSGFHNLGTVLQSRLFRTNNDLKRFDERMRVRMVIGIYQEPKEIALTEKPAMKKVLLEHARDLLSRGTYVELATHDEECLHNFFTQTIIPREISPSQFETQYLLGVPRNDLQQALVSGKYFIQMAENASGQSRNYLASLAYKGTVVRMYLPYGKDNVAGPYCKRRLKANPHMISYGIKNLLHIK